MSLRSFATAHYARRMRRRGRATESGIIEVIARRKAGARVYECGRIVGLRRGERRVRIGSCVTSIARPHGDAQLYER
jgi:hypothetical protein